MSTATPPLAARRTAVELSERDLLIQSMNADKRRYIEELGDLKRQLDAAQKLVDELDRPRKELERIGNLCQAVTGTALAAEGDARRAIEKLTPPLLKNAIANMKDESAVRTGDRKERSEAAVRQLEALIYQPGDLLPRIKAILTELSQGDMEDLQ